MLEAGCVGPPVFVHFDEELEEDLLLEEVFDVLACLGADALESRTGFADDDTLLGIALAVDDGIDADEFVLFLEGLHFNLDRIRDLLVVVEEDLLADDLINEESRGFVGQLVLWEEGWSDGQGFFDSIEELRDAETLLRGDGEDLCLGELRVPEGYEGLEGLLSREVNLIDDEKDRRRSLLTDRFTDRPSSGLTDRRSGRSFCWIVRRAFALAVLQARMTNAQS